MTQNHEEIMISSSKCSTEAKFLFHLLFICVFSLQFDFLHMPVLLTPSGDSPFPAVYPFISCLSVLS